MFNRPKLCREWKCKDIVLISNSYLDLAGSSLDADTICIFSWLLPIYELFFSKWFSQRTKDIQRRMVCKISLHPRSFRLVILQFSSNDSYPYTTSFRYSRLGITISTYPPPHETYLSFCLWRRSSCSLLLHKLIMHIIHINGMNLNPSILRYMV